MTGYHVTSMVRMIRVQRDETIHRSAERTGFLIFHEETKHIDRVRRPFIGDDCRDLPTIRRQKRNALECFIPRRDQDNKF